MVPLKLDIPGNFYEEEKRCGYTITSEMKKVWAVELDLLNELLRVCRKYNIKIFASGGTLLGAIRHKGMIPWDDDIDMMMFRGDYERLCEIANDEFRQPYFFQTEYTDPGSLRGHAQLRNSLTTAILVEEKEKARFNQGIFIDIFPLDAVIENDTLFKQQYKKAELYKRMAWKFSRLSTRCLKGNCIGLKGTVKKMIFPISNRIIRKLKLEEKAFEKFEKICQKYNEINTEKVSTLTFQFANKQHFKYRKDFDEILYVPFEFLKIPIGKNYDHALHQRNGDYMKIIKNGNCHGTVIFDTDKSYTQYIR